MIAALQDACAWEFVEPMEQGIHSQLGEGGKGVSEGQAQRIAIARALIRNAPVMLLDEVTSALDQATEERVLENLTHRGVTTILTTHRPSVLSQCSRVYRVQGGRVEQI
jgi:ABC-type bacteriocin/lantibiotic exporter with double-glycine peptidase domain